MPIYIQIANFVVPKDIICKKYPSGFSGFITDTCWGKVEFDSEDDELLSFAAMNPEEFEIITLESAGFKLNIDYAIVTRYFQKEILPKWLHHNGIFVWHRQCDQKLINLAEKHANISADEFFKKELYANITQQSLKSE